MDLLLKCNSEIGKRPDLGCQVSKAKSMPRCLSTDGAKKAVLTEMCENSVSFKFSRNHADNLNDTSGRGEGLAKQRCCQQGCWYHLSMAVGTQKQYWKSSLSSSIPAVLAKVQQKLCPATDWRWDLWPHSPYLLSPSTHSLFALFRDKD